MNIIKSSGESSCKGRENGDATTGSERPLKKARFSWQVKGKYHLKNDTDESHNNLIMPSTDTEPTCEPSPSQSTSTDFASEVGDYIVKENYSKLDSIISQTADSCLLTSHTNISRDLQQYPRYLSSHERPSNNILRSYSSKNLRTVPMVDNAEDLCITQWQSRQLVKGCLDNTLNRVLESWTTDPFPAEEANPNRFLALDFAEFINHLPGDNSVENEGILMAISAHGLQNTSSSSSNNSSNADYCSTSSPCVYDIPSAIQSLSPIVSDDDDCQQTNALNTKDKTPNIDWQCDNQNTSNTTPFAYFSEPSQSSYEFYEDSHQNSNTDSSEIESHYDFMNAAVLFAIQSKGLTASGTEYG